MNKIDLRARRIYDYLRERLNEPVRKQELLDELGLQSSKTTRVAIGRARDLAAADDLYLTIPVEANGFTMAVTDDVSAAVDPALWLSRVEHGVAVPRHIADDFMRSRMENLTPIDRAYVHMQDRINASVGSIQEAASELVKAQMEFRRELRAEVEEEAEA